MRLWLLVICRVKLDRRRMEAISYDQNLKSLQSDISTNLWWWLDIRRMKETSFFRQFSIFTVAGGILRFCISHFLKYQSTSDDIFIFSHFYVVDINSAHCFCLEMKSSAFSIISEKLKCLRFIIQSKMAKRFSCLRWICWEKKSVFIICKTFTFKSNYFLVVAKTSKKENQSWNMKRVRKWRRQRDEWSGHCCDKTFTSRV